MVAGTEAGIETFGSLISADTDTENEVVQPEAAGPEQPFEPSVEKNALLRPEKPIINPEAAGPETPTKTLTVGYRKKAIAADIPVPKHRRNTAEEKDDNHNNNVTIVRIVYK